MNEMSYVSYNEDSILYPGDSVHDLDGALEHVRNNYDIYVTYKDSIFSGSKSDLINQAVRMIFSTRIEPIGIGKYVTILDPNTTSIPPIGYSIPVKRHIYKLGHIRDNIYIQEDVLPQKEVYMVALMGNKLIYQGKYGIFELTDVEPM